MTDRLRIPISCNALVLSVGWLAGMVEGNCWIDIGDDTIKARMGPLCSITIPRALVTGAREIEWAWWHGLGGRIYGRMAVGFVGRPDHVVELTFSEPVTAINLFPKRCTRFAVSVDDPEALVAAASPVTGPSH